MGEKLNYEDFSDISLMMEYRRLKDPEIINVMIKRHYGLLLQIIKQWHSINRDRIYMAQSDMDDTLSCAYLGLIFMMNNVRNIPAIKNVGSRMKAYIYAVLDSTFRYRKYESFSGNVDFKKDQGRLSDEGTTLPYNGRAHIFIAYSYNYYQLGLMMSGSTTKKSIKSHVQKLKARVCTIDSLIP